MSRVPAASHLPSPGARPALLPLHVCAAWGNPASPFFCPCTLGGIRHQHLPSRKMSLSPALLCAGPRGASGPGAAPFFVAQARRSRILRWADKMWHVLGRPLTARLNGRLQGLRAGRAGCLGAAEWNSWGRKSRQKLGEHGG